jgi:alkylated DNA repair dioxygenase AlkB
MFKTLGGNLNTKTIDFTNFKFEDWRLFIEMMQTYTKQKPDAVIQYIDQGQVYSGSALVTGIVSKTVNSWVSNLKGLSKEEDSVIKWDSVDKSYSVTDLSGIPTGTPEEKVKFLAKLGIIFPIEAWAKLKEPQQKEFTIAVANIKEYLQKAKEIKSIQKKTLDVAGHYDTLATLLVNVTHPNQESTRINIDGKQSNSFTDNNVPSVFENEFNEVATLDELLAIRPELKDLYSRGALLLKKGGQFFDKEGNRTSLQLKVGYIEGTKNKDTNKGTSSTALTEGDRYTQEINQNLNGQYYIMIPADGSTEWMMNMGNHVAFEDIEQGKDGWKKINEIFRGYLTDDVALALDADNRMQLRNVGKKGKDLRFFKDILSEKTLSKINQMIEENATQADIEKYIDDNIDDVNASIKQYIDGTVAKTTDFLLQNNQVTFVSRDAATGIDYYRYNMLNGKFATNEKLNKNKLTIDDLTNIITFANANYIINNIEFHKIIFGDPYQFAIKEDGTLDATKRYKSFFSPRRTTIDSPELNTFINEDLNNAGDIQLLPGEPGYHEAKAWMDTVTVNDVNIVGSVANMENVPEDVRKAFAKTNEGDASSIMMDGTYREMKIKNGQWNINGVEEAWHQWQMAYTRQNLPGFKYSNDARGKALEKHDIALLKTKEPNHKIEVIKPIVSGVTNGENKINLILDKFSQMPLYYSMVKETNLEKLYLKMMAEKKGYIIMISGRKVGAEALYDLYTPKGEFNDAAFNNNIEVPWKAYGIQVETAYEGSGMQTRGSQLTKLSTLDLYNNGEPIGATPERREEIAKEVNRNREILNDLHRNGYERFLKRLGIEDLGGSYKIVDKRRLAKTLKDEMFRRELSDNVKDSIQQDENGEFIIPFEASPAYLQIKSILYSFIDKEITSPKVHGGSYVQAPVTLWENAKAGRKIAVKTKDGYRQITRQEFDALSPEQQSKVILTDDTLKFYEDKDGKRYCEIMIPHWFKNKLGKHAGKSDKELIEFLNTTKEGKDLLSGIGFRIPTQSLSSVEVFKVKEFLPQYMGKTVIVPSEITTKAGSDFDIDKLNMYLKSVYIDKNGEIRIIKLKGTEEATKDFYGKVFDEKLEKQKIKKAELFDAAVILVEDLDDPNNLVEKYSDALDILLGEAYTLEERRDVLDDIMKKLETLGDKDVQAVLKEKFVEDSYRRALENEYYDSLEKLVTMPENFQRLISPVSDDGLKDISKELDKLRGYDENNIKNRLLDRNYMTSLRHAFITAKKWVGIAAVNITGHSLTQKFKAYIDPVRFSNVSAEDRNILKYNGGEMLLDHNTIEDNGKSYISLSGRLDADGKFISDGLSGYATSFVDVAKDPYILKIIKSNLAVGTFMFLRRVGVPNKQLIMFMNQPIIDEYLTMLDNKGAKNLFDSRNISAIKNKFPSTVAETASTLGFNKEELEANIEKYYATKNLGDAKNREQVAIFNEFLKYAKMAEYSFNFGQASNYDTTKFQSGDSLQLKQWRTETAQKKNIISSVGDLLEKNFIGQQVEYLDMSMDAMGEALVLETPQFTDVINEVLKAYEQDRFLSKDKFDRIANKIKAAFLDYIIQKRSDIATNLQEQLVDDKKSVAQMLLKAKQEFPGVQIIEDLEVDSSGRIGGAQTIKLKVNDKIAYNENMYTGMMRELRDDPRTNALYKGIVRLAILQGTYQSPISIKNIIPVEDYAKHITPILAGLTVDDDIRAFAKSNEFQRNEWQDNDVVPVIEPTFQEQGFRTPEQEEAGKPRKFQGLFKVLRTFNGEKIKVPGFFPTITELGVNTNNRDLMFINSKYQGKVANYDVIKVPRTVRINKNDVTEGNIDVATGKEITAADYAERTKKGDLSLRNYYGYQKVKYADGSPVVAYYDKDGNPVYVYKFINLHGDGQYATEYYGDGRPSIFNNGSQKNVRNVEGTLVSNEIPDQAIIDYYGGESVPLDEADPIIATIERESENLTPTQPSTTVEPKGEKVKDGIYINQEGLTKEEQLELFDYLKPFLEEQAAKTNKGTNASKMIGLGLRWDYKSNNSGKQAMNIPDVISEGNKNKYGYYNTSINNQPLGQITPRFRELMEKATGVDMTNYDGAIINLYDNESFISSHNDVDESRSALKYPVIGINLGGTGNFSIESRDGDPKQLNLKAGAGYVFGVDGTNRAVFHRTFPGKQNSFLPELTTKLDGKTYEPGSYRVTITMRRVMPLEEGMPISPVIKSQPSQPVVLETKDRQITVNQFNITLKPDGTMFYDNGKEVTDQTTKNKVNVRKELQDGTLRSSVYNNSNYFVLLDNRIVGSGKTNLGKESITDPKIKEAILAKAVTYKKTC